MEQRHRRRLRRSSSLTGAGSQLSSLTGAGGSQRDSPSSRAAEEARQEGLILLAGIVETEAEGIRALDVAPHDDVLDAALKEQAARSIDRSLGAAARRAAVRRRRTEPSDEALWDLDVRTLAGKRLAVRCRPSMSLMGVLRECHRADPLLRPEQQVVVFKGKRQDMASEAPLDQLGISDGSKLYLVRRLTQGPSGKAGGHGAQHATEHRLHPTLTLLRRHPASQGTPCV